MRDNHNINICDLKFLNYELEHSLNTSVNHVGLVHFPSCLPDIKQKDFIRSKLEVVLSFFKIFLPSCIVFHYIIFEKPASTVINYIPRSRSKAILND